MQRKGFVNNEMIIVLDKKSNTLRLEKWENYEKDISKLVMDKIHGKPFLERTKLVFKGGRVSLE